MSKSFSDVYKSMVTKSESTDEEMAEFKRTLGVREAEKSTRMMSSVPDITSYTMHSNIAYKGHDIEIYENGTNTYFHIEGSGIVYTTLEEAKEACDDLNAFYGGKYWGGIGKMGVGGAGPVPNSLLARQDLETTEKSEQHVEGKGGHVSNHPLTCPLCQRLGKSETPIDDSTVMVMTVEDMKTASIVDRIKARQAPRENTTVKRQQTTAKSFKDVWAEKNTSRTLTKSQEMEKAFSDAPDAVRDAIASYIVGGMMGDVDGDTLLREIQSKFAGQIRQYNLDVVKLMQLLRSPFNKSWGSPTANKNSASVFVRSMLRELKSGSEMGKAATSDLYKIATDVAQEWGCTKAEATQLVMAEARKMGVSH